MSRRGRVRHSVVRMKLSAAAVLQCRADITAVIVGSGKIQVRAGRRTKPLAALETLIVDDESEANLQIMTDNEAELFVVDLWHVEMTQEVNLRAIDLPIDAARLWDDVMALAKITEPDRPYTRRSFSPLFLKGRTWLTQRFAEAGLAVTIDAAGNLIGRHEGRDPSLGVIAVGSHSDTVPLGGRFDGIAGLIAGLEIVRSLRDAGVQLDHAIEVIDFLAEEPSDYGLSCVGSRGITGVLTPPMLDFTEQGGETLRDALRRAGGHPDRLDRSKRSDIRAFLELHIEQGSILESQSLDVGIVTSIVGIRRIEIVFNGAADHSRHRRRMA